MEKFHRVLQVTDLKAVPQLDGAYRLLASQTKAWGYKKILPEYPARPICSHLCLQKVRVKLLKDDVPPPWQVSSDDIQTVVYCDCTKFGVMSQPEVNAIGEFLEKTLFRNPYSPSLVNGTFFLVETSYRDPKE